MLPHCSTRTMLGDCNAPVALRGCHRRMVFGFRALLASAPRPQSSSISTAPARPWRSASTACRAIAGGCRPPGRLHHPARHLSPANDGAALVLAPLLQFTDAVFDFLPWRLRHSRHLRNLAAGRTGLARLRAARSGPRRHPVRAGRAGRHGPDHDRGTLNLLCSAVSGRGGQEGTVLGHHDDDERHSAA